MVKSIYISYRFLTLFFHFLFLFGVFPLPLSFPLPGREWWNDGVWCCTGILHLFSSIVAARVRAVLHVGHRGAMDIWKGVWTCSEPKNNSNNNTAKTTITINAFVSSVSTLIFIQWFRTMRPLSVITLLSYIVITTFMVIVIYAFATPTITAFTTQTRAESILLL